MGLGRQWDLHPWKASNLTQLGLRAARFSLKVNCGGVEQRPPEVPANRNYSTNTVPNSVKKRYDCKGFGYLLISFCETPEVAPGQGGGTQEMLLQQHPAFPMHCQAETSPVPTLPH